MVYTAWHIRRLSFDLFFALLGISFFLVLLLTPPRPGGSFGCCLCSSSIKRSAAGLQLALAYTFTLLYVACNFLAMEQPVILGSLAVNHFAADLENAAWRTGQEASEHGAAHDGARHHVPHLAGDNTRQRLFPHQPPFVRRRHREAGIPARAEHAGAVADGPLGQAFGCGCRTTTITSGTCKPMWQAMTHLNPRANDLQQFTRDAIALADGKSIQKPHYDHVSGYEQKPLHEKRDFILVSGLHALYLPILRERYDLGIYLAMDERLRRYFKLLRDVKQRNGTVENVMAALERREKDARQFIRPQEAHAGLVLSLQPLHAMRFDETEDCRPLRLKLGVRGRYGLHEEALVRTLVGVCGLHVEMDISGDNSAVSLTIEGDVSAEDIGLAARELFPDMVEMLDTRPQWKDGMEGLMQLVVLSHINQAMRRRTL